MNQNTDEKVAIYSRKSKFTGKGESIENQIELCRQYIFSHFPAIAPENIFIYEDEGFSGGNTERPKFKRMMNEARGHKFSAIVCYRLDRISRNIGDFANLIEDLNNLQISFISIKEQFDTSSPMGRAMMYICSVFSQLERETIAERIRDNMRELSKTGRWLGGVTPTGYASESIDNISHDGKVRKSCRLKLLPDEASLIRLIFAKFLETHSLAKTEAFLLQHNYFTKNGKPFNRFAIKNILANPVYMDADRDAFHYLVQNNTDLFSEEAHFNGKHGVMAYNRTLQRPGKANQIKPMAEWIVSVGTHKGIVSGADWVKAQTLLAENKSSLPRKPRSSIALLAGLLFCADCGEQMRPKRSARRNENGDQVYSYICTGKEKSKGRLCNMKNANGNLLDRIVCSEIQRFEKDGSVLIQKLKSGRYQVSGDWESSDLEVHSLSDTEYEIVLLALSSFQHTFARMSIEQKQAALRLLIKKAVWDNQEVHLYL